MQKATKRPIYGLAAALVVVLSIGLFAGTASAQGEYTGGGTLALDKTTATVGESVGATATGFESGASVAFVFNSDPVDIGTVTADADGVASTTFTVPSVELGTHTVTATGISATTGEVVTLSSQIEIVAIGTDGTGTGTGTGSDGSLPRTGSNSTDLLRVGALLVAAGGAVVLITRKRAQAKIDA